MFRLGVRAQAVCGAAVAAASLVLSGCDSGPTAVPVPTINPATCASEALAEYDANKDGALDADELKKVPGFTHHPEKFDQNGDKKVDQQELTKRFSEIYASQTGLMSFAIVVKYNGKPLEGAKVKLIPEKFLGGAIKPAEGTSDSQGYAAMTVAEADMPADIRGKVKAVHNGIYKVEITHPTTALPPIYNTATTLGAEVTNDTNLQPTSFDLKAK